MQLHLKHTWAMKDGKSKEGKNYFSFRNQQEGLYFSSKAAIYEAVKSRNTLIEQSTK